MNNPIMSNNNNNSPQIMMMNTSQASSSRYSRRQIPQQQQRQNFNNNNNINFTNNNNSPNPMINSQSFRGDLQQIQQQIRSIEDQIQFTICNYESILQTQKKNTSQRNQFLLYLIQSMKQKQNQELLKYQSQLANIMHQKQQANSLQSQMKNIGQGVDSILQQGKRLKQANSSLVKQLQEQNLKEKQLDEQIQSHLKQIDDLRTQVDQWEVKKIKWNRKKKDMIQLIQDTENVVKRNGKYCPQTGLEEENCQHCETLNMKKLMSKYQQQNGK